MQGIHIQEPHALTHWSAARAAIVDEWIVAAADFLLEPFIPIRCLVNSKADFIGGRLPTQLLDRLVERLNQRLRKRGGEGPRMSPVPRAAMAADAPAVGLPFQQTLQTSRTA